MMRHPNALWLGLALPFAGSAAAQDELPPPASIPVIMSSDCGTEIDDQWTVMYLVLSPELRPLGFIGNHAPNGVDGAKARDTILDALEERLGMADHPPVLAGADHALTSREEPLRTEGAEFLVEQSRAFSPTDRLTVFVTGSHTDVASAILIDPTIVDRIRIVCMGFADWPEGGDEWNIKNDVRAVQIVLDSGVPIVAAPGTTCRRDLGLTTEEAKALVADLGVPGAWLAKCFEEFPHRFPERGGVWPIWDNAVMAYALGFARTRDVHRPRLLDDMRFDHSAPSGQMGWVDAIDSARMWADFTTKLKAWVEQ